MQSAQNARHAFRRDGLATQMKKKKPHLLSKNVDAHLEFAKLHKDWTVID